MADEGEPDVRPVTVEHPITASAFLRSPNFSTHSLATMGTAIGVARTSRSQEKGSFMTNFTVYRSTASTRSTDFSMYAIGLPFTVRNRSKL
jgi:hypothetical protein